MSPVRCCSSPFHTEVKYGLFVERPCILQVNGASGSEDFLVLSALIFGCEWAFCLNLHWNCKVGYANTCQHFFLDLKWWLFHALFNSACELELVSRSRRRNRTFSHCRDFSSFSFTATKLHCQSHPMGKRERRTSLWLPLCKVSAGMITFMIRSFFGAPLIPVKQGIRRYYGIKACIIHFVGRVQSTSNLTSLCVPVLVLFTFTEIAHQSFHITVARSRALPDASLFLDCTPCHALHRFMSACLLQKKCLWILRSAVLQRNVKTCFKTNWQKGKKLRNQNGAAQV